MPSYKKQILFPLLLHLTSFIVEIPRLLIISNSNNSFAFFHTTKEPDPSTITNLLCVEFQEMSFISLLWKERAWKEVFFLGKIYQVIGVEIPFEISLLYIICFLISRYFSQGCRIFGVLPINMMKNWAIHFFGFRFYFYFLKLH